MALGHVRYSTTGDGQLANVQPLQAELKSESLALAHNGNIVNALELRRKLQQQGSIFQGDSDTECLLHLLAQRGASTPKREQNKSFFLSELQESLRQLEGAYSLVLMTRTQLFAIRDPHGFRPLVLGRHRNDQGKHIPVISSESCAFDLIGATYEREIAPGELFSVNLNHQEESHFFFSSSPSSKASKPPPIRQGFPPIPQLPQLPLPLPQLPPIPQLPLLLILPLLPQLAQLQLPVGAFLNMSIFPVPIHWCSAKTLTAYVKRWGGSLPRRVPFRQTL